MSEQFTISTVPLPNPCGRPSRYPYRQLAVGESFFRRQRREPEHPVMGQDHRVHFHDAPRDGERRVGHSRVPHPVTPNKGSSHVTSVRAYPNQSTNQRPMKMQFTMH